MIKELFLEIKWQLYRPIIWILYGFGFLIVDLFLDMRDRKKERSEVKTGWEDVKTGLIQNDPHTVAYGQSTMKTKIFLLMGESMN